MIDELLAEARLADLHRTARCFEPMAELEQQHRRSEAPPPHRWLRLATLDRRPRHSAANA